MPPTDTLDIDPIAIDTLDIDTLAIDPTADRFADASGPSDPIANLARPVAGVSLELYARIVKSIEIVNHDLSLLAPMAAAHGVSREAWVQARLGWNERIASEPAIRELFQVLYRGCSS